jgi:hypothetical protein
VRHSRQDALDTAARRAASSERAWHPLLAAVEPEPGLWYMVDSTRLCYGVIRYLTIRGQSGYRAVTWATRSEERQLIGYFTTLAAATSAAHERYVQGQGRNQMRG